MSYNGPAVEAPENPTADEIVTALTRYMPDEMFDGAAVYPVSDGVVEIRLESATGLTVRVTVEAVS
jgi:hypothetical protein